MLKWTLQGIMFVGFVGAITLDPDVPGAQLTNLEMITAYAVLVAMVVLPVMIQHRNHWHWFDSK